MNRRESALRAAIAWLVVLFAAASAGCSGGDFTDATGSDASGDGDAVALDAGADATIAEGGGKDVGNEADDAFADATQDAPADSPADVARDAAALDSPADGIACGVCLPMDQCHVAGVCIPGTGVCSNPIKTDGTQCDDRNACTNNDVCGGGVCTGSIYSCTPTQCQATSTCNGAGGCTIANSAAGSACNDGDPCTTPDQCNGAGACVGTVTALTNCGGSCKNLGTDHDHCGACNVACAFDESCQARLCTVSSWTKVGAAINPVRNAFAHALGNDGTRDYVAWVAAAPINDVYVHRIQLGNWVQVGSRLSSGLNPVPPFVDIQFNGAVPNVLFAESSSNGDPNFHVKAFDGLNWPDVTTKNYTSACYVPSATALALDGATPHLTYVGAGGCGIGVGYAYATPMTLSGWWDTPMPPGPMPGLITMSSDFSSAGTVDVVHDGTRALLVISDNGVLGVRYWVPAPLPGAWATLDGPLNIGVPIQFAHISVSMITAPGGVLYVAWSETVAGTPSIFVKRHDAGGWSLVGGGRVSTAGAAATLPSIALVGGTPYVAFVEQNGGVGEIHVRRLNGVSWQRVGAPLNEDLTQNATAPYLISVGAAPHVAFRQTDMGSDRIYVKQFP